MTEKQLIQLAVDLGIDLVDVDPSMADEADASLPSGGEFEEEKEESTSTHAQSENSDVYVQFSPNSENFQAQQ